MPNLFIIGAPKCGTTSLYEWLKGHPDVFMAPFKEPCYFARDLAFETSSYYFRYDADRERYLALFAGAGTEKRLGEASTRYLYSKDAPRLIAAEAPDPRIVVMLRNPVDMMASLHAHKLASGTEDLAELGDAVAAEEDRRSGRRLPPNSNPLLSTYLERAMFGDQLARWFDVFGRERIHVMIFEDVVREPAADFRALLEFLDLDQAYLPTSFAAHNPAHGSRAKLIGSVARSRPVQFAIGRLLPFAIGDVRTLELTRRLAQSRLFRRRMAAKAEVPVHLRRRLEAELAPDVERLSGLLEYDLSSRWFGADRGVTQSAQIATE